MSHLRKLIVENFQSHEHTEVVFGPGLNVIVGPSDYGKSALVRALRWVFFNEPKGANFIRVGARTCRVTVEMEDGTRITRLRTTGGRNQYLLQKAGEQEQVFEGFGSEIPQEIVQASGMRKVVIDDRNKAELNFGGQLEGPFLLTENGAVRAKVIGQLGGVHILDWAQKSTATELRRLREEDGQLNAALKDLEEALHAYDHLPHLEETIKRLEALFGRIEEISRMIDALSDLAGQWQELECALEETHRVLEGLAFVEQAEDGMQRLEVLAKDYAYLSSLAEDLRRVDFQLQQVERLIAETGHVPELEARLERLEELYRQLHELAGVAQELGTVSRTLGRCAQITARTEMLEKSEEYLSGAADVLRLIGSYQELLAAWQDHQRDYQGVSLAVERYQKEVERYLEEYRKVLNMLGKCPVCFGELTADAIQRALAEYE
ncbi:MAG TPA: AAA family ATPase [Syntrophomonadaceae bacterium]|nr:AAA family ATPase [Syntrophomonadaceae bacterium]